MQFIIMAKNYIEGKKYQNEQSLPKGEYENCVFLHGLLAKSDLSDYVFIDCVFEDCDLSMAIVRNTAFRGATFKDCKLLGINFDECKSLLLSFSFQNCTLNFASFYRLNLKNTHFRHCNMQEVEFVETDLSKAIFEECDLRNASFENSILEAADLRTAFHFSIDPEKNRIAKAKFASHNLAGLLNKYKIVIE